MITEETKAGVAHIDETMKSPAIKEHMKSRKIETDEDWQDALRESAGIRQWWDRVNGQHEGQWSQGYAIHHAQVWTPEATAEPLNFFVVDKKLTAKQFGKDNKKDKNTRDLSNIVFPQQVVFNPEIITALQTFLNKVPGKHGVVRTSAVPNTMRYDEGCMSFAEGSRKARKMTRFYRIKVRYQVVKKSLLGKPKIETIEEWCQGLKAHIFQHEIDHGMGHDIYHGFGNKEFLTVEDREREDGYTRKEVEEFTAKRITEIEEKVQKNGVCILQSVTNGMFYRTPTDLTELPKGFIEPDIIEIYDHETGAIKPPYDEAPWYDDPSAHEEIQVPDDIGADFNSERPVAAGTGKKPKAMMSKNKLMEFLRGFEPSPKDGCYYLDDEIFSDLASKLIFGEPDPKTILEIYPDLVKQGFTVHGLVIYPLSKNK